MEIALCQLAGASLKEITLLFPNILGNYAMEMIVPWIDGLFMIQVELNDFT